MDPQVYKNIELVQFMSEVTGYKERGWRFVNLCGSSVGDQVELLCSFALDNQLENLSMLVSNGEQVPAISPLYPSAFFFENETRDLFGVQFEGTIIDFAGRFYPTSVPTPMNPTSVEAEAWGKGEEVPRG
ncbi:MAG: NADH-quinone oxidoreductase subunit C [Coriobacteriales bacterium]|jgi:ech hydrogenase subunit D|nr:NADH-quinone oxidoreductase subunit C [Coriobacteriales bacterium]